MRAGDIDVEHLHEVYDPDPGCGHDGCGPWIGWEYHMSSWFRSRPHWFQEHPDTLLIARDRAVLRPKRPEGDEETT